MFSDYNGVTLNNEQLNNDSALSLCGMLGIAFYPILYRIRAIRGCKIFGELFATVWMCLGVQCKRFWIGQSASINYAHSNEAAKNHSKGYKSHVNSKNLWLWCIGLVCVDKWQAYDDRQSWTLNFSKKLDVNEHRNFHAKRLAVPVHNLQLTVSIGYSKDIAKMHENFHSVAKFMCI